MSDDNSVLGTFFFQLLLMRLRTFLISTKDVDEKEEDVRNWNAIDRDLLSRKFVARSER